MLYNPRKSFLFCYHADALSALGAPLCDNLAALNQEMHRLLLARKATLRGISPHGFKDARVFQLLAPLSRDLTNLLHQRCAAENFKMRTLQRLQTFVKDELDAAAFGSYRSLLDQEDVAGLPVTGVLMGDVDAVLGKPTATTALSGQSLSELSKNYNKALTKAASARSSRIQSVLKKIRAALPADDFEFLRASLTLQDLQRFKA